MTISLASREDQVFELRDWPRPAALTSASSIWFECSHSLSIARLSLPPSGELELWWMIDSHSSDSPSLDDCVRSRKL